MHHPGRPVAQGHTWVSSAGKVPAEAAHFGSSLALHPEGCLAGTAVLHSVDSTEASANAHASQEFIDDLSILFMQSGHCMNWSHAAAKPAAARGQHDLKYWSTLAKKVKLRLRACDWVRSGMSWDIHYADRAVTPRAVTPTGKPQIVGNVCTEKRMEGVCM